MNTLFIPKDSFIHRLDPRTKMIFILFVVISTFLLNDPGMQLVLLASLFLLVITAKIVKEYLKSMQIFLLFIVLVMTVHGIYNPIGKTPIFTLFGSLSFKYESLVYASIMSFRVLVIGTGALLFVMTTHPSDMASALVKWKTPHAVAFMLLATFQIIPIIMREANIVMEAQQARCLDIKGNVIQRVRNLVPLFAPLFITTFMKVHQLSYVLECRAFSAPGKKTSLRDTNIGIRDHIFYVGMVIVLIGEIALRIFASQSIHITTSALLLYSLLTVWVLVILFLGKAIVRKVFLSEGVR
ncbi:MAG: energy-coupling factor transporter transmembrane component T family protein [Desulfitobacteriaceae bacterium]